jgi:hypothetical protein
VITIPSVAKGAAPDVMPAELGDGMWTTLTNCAVRGDFLQRTDGNGALVSTPSAPPYFLLPYSDGASLGLIHVGLASAFVDIANVRTDLTHATPWTGTTSDKWTGCNFNGRTVINNGVNKPAAWDGNLANNFVDLTAWDANVRCKVLRQFGNFLVAMDITESGVRKPSRVLWSNAADPGSLPSSWAYGDPTVDAGDDGVEGGGVLVDGLTLGDSFVLYKSASTSLMRFVGGNDVMSIKEIPGGQGLLAAGCAVSTPVGHVCLTTGDIVVHQGGAPRSIASDLVRNTIFRELSKTYASRAFLSANPSQNEVWVCYPTTGGTCSKAAVWNWQRNTWSFRTLRSVTHATTGQMPSPRGTPWNEGTGSWAEQTGSWGGAALAPNDQKLVFAHSLPAISMLGYGQQDVGVPITVVAERTGISLADAQRRKVLRHLWPRIDAADGTQILITCGASDQPGGPVTWGTEATYTVGTDEKVSPYVAGRYLAIRLRSTADAAWRTRSMDLDVATTGTH